MKIQKLKTCAALSAVILAVSACAPSLTQDTPPASLYVLNPLVAPAQMEATANTMQLYVQKPTVPPGFDTEKIVVIKEDREMDYISGAEWSGQLGEVLKTYLTQSLENRLPVGTVLDENVRQEAGYVLVSTVRSFEAHYADEAASSAPRVDVEIAFALHNREDAKIETQVIITQSVQASDNTVTAIVAAFEQALADVTELSLKRLF